MSIKDFMFFALIIVDILVIINCTFVAYLYLSYEYKKVNKFFLSWGNGINYDSNRMVRGWIVSVL